ncbi:formin-like protein 4 [Silene latifolia]|uniref:formin-like protein 4 n=1 Tax=Silene latifolia TaxID=37657 RepID=UPI003D77599C
MSFQTNLSHLFFLSLLLLFLNSFSLCQSNSPQNIQVVYPYSSPPLIPPSLPPPPLLQPLPPPPSLPSKKSTSKKTIATAIGVTAASTLVAAALLFFVCTRYGGHTKKAGSGHERVNPYAARPAAGSLQPVSETQFTRFDGNIKGLIVDEDGLDVLYWRKLEGSQRKSGPFHKEVFNNNNINKPPSGRRNIPRGKSSSSSSNKQIHPKDDQKAKLLDSKLPSSSDRVKEERVLNDSHDTQIVSRQPSHVVAALPPPPPPPPLPPQKKAAPPVPLRKGPAPPPPPAKGGSGSGSSSRPPAAPKGSASVYGVVEVSALGVDGVLEDKNDHVKLKPLHWEKVNVANRDHSMVWDKLDRGSFQYNGDMMEALFGTIATNRKSPKDNNTNAPNPASKIFILDSRRSQNIAIVIRSLNTSRQELIDGLLEGRGLNIETLEKLTRMAPTNEETSQILAFIGEVERLADAESFLYRLLKAIPSAFSRVNALLFRHTNGSEIQQLKDTLHTVDSACTELRSRGVFLKLLEAILKAGNRLNAGTTRGDAKAFNLTGLRKLSDYKSSDGKTTLLHFVVHEVVRNEGRRCVMNRNNSLSRSSSQKNPSATEPSNLKEEQEREFLKLGLPVVGGLSSEFTNVKKAAMIDYDTMVNITTSLGDRIAETRKIVLQIGTNSGKGEFIAEMKEFLGEAEREVNDFKEEQTRVMEFVKKTTMYYQSGGFKEKQPLQMFAIVKDFLGMVDNACIDITRSLQKKKGNSSGGGPSASPSSPTSPPSPDVLRTRVTFPRLPDHFLSEKSTECDTDDD